MLSPRAYSVFVCFAAAFGSLLFGYQVSYMTMFLGLNAVRGMFDLDVQKFRESFLASFFIFGSIAGSLLISAFGHKVARKLPIYLGCTFVVTGTVFQVFQSSKVDFIQNMIDPNKPEHANIYSKVYEFPSAKYNNPAFIIAGRFFGGVGVGILASVVPIFISEVATADIRGILSTINQFMITFGILLAAIVNDILYFTIGVRKPDSPIWKWIIAMPFIPAIALFAMMAFVPESPRALIALNKRKEAIKALSAHRCVSVEQVMTEFNEIEKEHKISLAASNGSWSDLMEPSILRRILTASMLQIFQQYSGINVIITWADTMFPKDKGLRQDYSLIVYPTILFFFNFVGTLPGMFLVDRLGRSRLLVLGGLGMVACFLTDTIMFAVDGEISVENGNRAELKNQYLKYIYVMCTYFYILFFASTWGPIVWTYTSEIFPTRVKSKCVGICTAANFFSGGILVFLWPTIRDLLKVYTFSLFLFTTIAMTTFAQFMVPETKGLKESQIAALFKGKPITDAADSGTFDEGKEKESNQQRA